MTNNLEGILKNIKYLILFNPLNLTYLNTKYIKILMNDFNLFVFYPILTSAITYWGTSFFWFILDLTLAPLFRVFNDEIDWQLYKKTLIHVFFLQMSTTPIIMTLLIPLWKYRNISTSQDDIFSFNNFFKLLLCPLLSDVVFYYSHKLIHNNYFYKNVHKLHHEWKNPCALCAAYTTFYEYIFCNLPTFLLPPLILGLNWYVANIWFVYATISVTTDHSGYIFFSKSIHHANHHKYTSYNYGSYFLDFLNNSLF